MTIKAPGSTNAFTTQHLTVINSPSKMPLDYTQSKPEETLIKLKAVKDEIAHLLKEEADLKQELENHFKSNDIGSQFISNGVMATRTRREGKWAYSEFTQQFILAKREEVLTQMALEQNDGIARRNDPSFSWTIRGEK